MTQWPTIHEAVVSLPENAREVGQADSSPGGPGIQLFPTHNECVELGSVKSASNDGLQNLLMRSGEVLPVSAGATGVKRYLIADSKPKDVGLVQQTCSSFPESNSVQHYGAHSVQTSSKILDLDALTRRYRTPATTHLDYCVRHFIEEVLCGVWDRDGSLHVKFAEPDVWNLYIASVGTGANLRWESTVLPPQMPIQQVAKQFHDQSKNALFSRLVDGHKRFVRLTLRESRRWQSRFEITRGSCDGVDYDWISVTDTETWLPCHQQLKLIMDQTRFINLCVPIFDAVMQDLIVEYVFAVLAAIYKLPKEQRFNYLHHQQLYLNGRATVELRWDQGNTQEQSWKIWQQALKQIANLFEAISSSIDSCNGYPTREQMKAAREFGLTMSLWEIGSYTYLAAFLDQKVNISEIRLARSRQWQHEMNPFTSTIKSAVYPALDVYYMEPEYALHANVTRLKVEQSGQLANLPDLALELAALPAAKVY
ncbi:hypothetical protein B0H14DRAFT_2759959 [Mycena olivaceomarginata]|nr:hypothetical protein B0H14DRAFT_2759959 [Mycena olivaceomarginata]